MNALLPLVRPSNSHPLCSSLTSTNADGTNTSNGGNGVDLKTRQRASLSSSIRRSSFAKQPPTFCSTIDSTKTAHVTSSSKQQLDSDSIDQTLLLANQYNSSNNLKETKSSSITPIDNISSLPTYQKQFMQKIDRFRFIDDSASSTTTVTSPVESLEHLNTQSGITNRNEHFNNYAQTRYNNDTDDDVDALIDRLNSNILSDGSYSDLNILNNISSTKSLVRPNTFKPVNNVSSYIKPSNVSMRKKKREILSLGIENDYLSDLFISSLL